LFFKDSGETRLKVALDKDVYFSDDKPNITITVDNSSCSKKIEAIEVSIQNKMKLDVHSSWNPKCQGLKNLEPIQNKTKYAIPAKHPDHVALEVSFNLANTQKIGVCKTKEKKRKDENGKKVKVITERSPEEMMLLSNIPSTSHSKFLESDLSLVVRAIYSSKMVTSEAPKVVIPITILPAPHNMV